MGVGGCGKCAKYLLFAVNIIFWIVGLVLLGIGIWILVDGDIQDNLTKLADRVKETGTENADAFNKASTALQTIPYVLIAIGGLTAIIGFFGCCGAIRESKCLLLFYIILVAIIMIALAGAGIFLLTIHFGIDVENVRDSTGATIRKAVEDVLVKDEENQQEGKKFSGTLTLLEASEELKCCGVVNAMSEGRLVFKVKQELNGTKICPNVEIVKDQAPEGCLNALLKLIKSKAVLVSIVMLGIAAFEILCIIMACCVCCGYGDHDDY